MESSGRMRGYRHAGVGRTVRVSAAVVLWAVFCVLASAGGALAVGRITVGAGSTVNLSDAAVRMGCGDFTVEDSAAAAIGAGTLGRVRDVRIEGSTGALRMAAGLLEFSGMWTVAGSFEPGSGTVTVVDGCADGPAVVNGDNGFYNFIITSSRGQEVKFEAGTTQTISNRFQSTGQDGMRTLLRSTAAGQAAFVCLDPGGTQMVEAIDVADNRVPDLNECQHLAPGDPSDHNSVDSGNTFGWFDNTGSGVPVPTLGRAGAAVLALLSLLLGGLAIRRLSAQT